MDRIGVSPAVLEERLRQVSRSRPVHEMLKAAAAEAAFKAGAREARGQVRVRDACGALVDTGGALVDCVVSATFRADSVVQPSYHLYAELQSAMHSFEEFRDPCSEPPTFCIPQGQGRPAAVVTADPRMFKLFDGHGFLDTACRFHSTYAALPAAASVLDVLGAFGNRLRFAREALGIEPELLLVELKTVLVPMAIDARDTAGHSSAPAASEEDMLTAAQLECLERGAILEETLLGVDLGLAFHRLQTALHQLLRDERCAADGLVQYMLGASATSQDEADSWLVASEDPREWRLFEKLLEAPASSSAGGSGSSGSTRVRLASLLDSKQSLLEYVTRLATSTLRSVGESKAHWAKVRSTACV